MKLYVKKQIEGNFYAVKKDNNGNLTDEVYDLDQYIKYANKESNIPPAKIGNFIMEKNKARFI